MDNLPESVRFADAQSAQAVVRFLRPEHDQEVFDTCGLSARDGLFISLAFSLEAYACQPEGCVVPLFLMGAGQRDIHNHRSVVWMLGTGDIDRYPRTVLRTARWGLRRAFAITRAAELVQRVPLWYRTGIQFVERLGFRPAPAGRTESWNGTPLVEMVLARHQCRAAPLSPMSRRLGRRAAKDRGDGGG